MPGDRRGGGPLINHDIGVVAYGPQRIYPVQVLLMSTAIIGENIYPPLSVALDGSQLHETEKIWCQVDVGIVPGEVNGLCADFI